MSLFGKGVGRICAVVAASSAREMAAQLRRAWRETPTVELRLDWLKSDSERRRLLHGCGATAPGAFVIVATCRRREGGGLFADSVQDEHLLACASREAGLPLVLTSRSKLCASFPQNQSASIRCRGAFCCRFTISMACLRCVLWGPLVGRRRRH